jgi:hypothetical protein
MGGQINPCERAEKQSEWGFLCRFHLTPGFPPHAPLVPLFLTLASLHLRRRVTEGRLSCRVRTLSPIHRSTRPHSGGPPAPGLLWTPALVLTPRTPRHISPPHHLVDPLFLNPEDMIRRELRHPPFNSPNQSIGIIFVDSSPWYCKQFQRYINRWNSS